LKSRLEFSLGSLGNDHVTAVVGSVGPMFSLAPSKSPVKLDGGFAPTGLSEVISSAAVGSLFNSQLDWPVLDHRKTFPRWLSLPAHVKRRLASDNEGVNMNTVSVEYCF